MSHHAEFTNWMFESKVKNSGKYIFRFDPVKKESDRYLKHLPKMDERFYRLVQNENGLLYSSITSIHGASKERTRNHPLGMPMTCNSKRHHERF